MDDDYWVEESSWKPCKKRKRRVGKRAIEFVGWGSRPLIEFLEAIGQDTSKQHSQREVAEFITKYINDNGLSCPQKKKKVLCDERLLALFGKKSVNRPKIYDMLEGHFAENLDDSDNEILDSSDEENHRKKNSGSKSNSTGQIKKIPVTPKSCFAAVIPENIKLVYLKRSVIQELLKDPESFEYKIVGSFVRMRSDPYDIYQKNRFQLQLVTGLEKFSGAGDAATEVCLKVSNFHKDVPLSMLSDDNFSEEEIEDVQNRIKAGLLKRLTVIDLEAKAKMLHVAITKHGIEKELSWLQNQINRANEKGWRREYPLDFTLFEYLDRRKLLQNPSEREKMLLKIPEVIAEKPEAEAEAEAEAIVAGDSEKAEGSGRSPKSILRGNSEVSSTDASGCADHVTVSQIIWEESPAVRGRNECTVNGVMLVEDSTGLGDANETSEQVKETEDPPAVIIKQEIQFSDTICDRSSEEMQQFMNSRLNDPPEEKQEQQSAKPQTTVDLRQQSTTPHVIELSDDDSENEEPNNKNSVPVRECLETVTWHYSDPQGLTRGPFSLYSLKRWSDANYFDPGFKVWKSGGDAVLLSDVLSRTFP